MDFEKRSQLKLTPKSLAVGLVKDHQQILGMLQAGSDVEDPLFLLCSVSLVDADAIQKHKLLRSPEEPHQPEDHKPCKQRPGS
eukprot:Skav214512  [mRNA]  locus=scaffold468:14333:14941:+ [translate_table: standard]